jgi:(p)ppGpp synthase/HD superfamily hydrolase
MPTETTTPRLTEKFHESLTYAAEKHHRQTRKGGDIPYIGHLLSVAGLVIEAGGTETQAIAALLHDAAEDQGGKETLVEIRERFGADVKRIVAECSDTFEDPKPPWRERKTSYIEHLKDASNETILVSLADKVDNARAILRDFRGSGSELWQRFSVKDPNDHLWYYRSLLDVYQHKTDSWLVDELRRTLDALEELVNA